MGRLAAEHSDCRGGWASADRWLPPGVGRWAACAKSMRGDTQRRAEPTTPARTLARPAGKWQRTRGGGCPVASDLERRGARTHTLASAYTGEEPVQFGGSPKARQRVGHMGRRGEISVEPFARRRDDYACVGQRRPRLEVPRHKRSGATPEGAWMRMEEMDERNVGSPSQVSETCLRETAGN